MSQTVDNSQCKVGGKRISQYAQLMKKFSESHREQCRTVDIPKAYRWLKQFPTGSQYEGTWDVLGMSGTGTYTFLNGVVYKGEFDDGMFHGIGELQYPDGTILKGKFRNGNIVERTLVFADGLEYNDGDWMYCQMPDRRFTLEYEVGVKPAGESFKTADLPTRDIPPGYYDTGDGFYDPKTNVVYKAEDINAIIRSPSLREQKWILENCRYSPEIKIGPRNDLYEEWLEPETGPEPPPLPAAVSRATMHLFETTESIIESCDSDTEVVDQWQNLMEASFEASPHLRRLKFQTSREIKVTDFKFPTIEEDQPGS